MNNNDYYYPGTNVLRNKLSITDQKTLEEYERRVVCARMIQLKANPVQGSYDLEHLKSIHKELYKDIYEWAGQIRTINISKGDDCFCQVQNIEPEMRKISNEIQTENFLKGLEKVDFTYHAVELLGKLCQVHPFKKGNERAEREFIRELAYEAGYKLELSTIQREFDIISRQESFRGNNFELERMIKGNLEPIRELSLERELERVI